MALAGLIERHYPSLGERLSSAVGLVPDSPQGHGAERLIALVREDAARQTAALDIAPVFTIGPSRRRFIRAALLLVLALAPVFLSSNYAYFGQRFVCCLFAPLAGYRMEVAPANATLASGRPVAIRVRLISEDVRVPLPKACFLMLSEAEGAVRHVMRADKEEFTFTLEKLTGDLNYRIEAGELTSAEYHLTAVQPIELADGSPRIEVTPPPYVNRHVHPLVTSTSGADFSALQFSTVRFEFRFSRAPVAVRLQVKGNQESWNKPVLHWDRGEEQAFVEFPAAELGSFTGTLTMEAEHGIKTIHSLPHWKVWPDEPPVFTRLPSPPASSAGWSEQNGADKALPDDVINVHTTVEDRVGVEPPGGGVPGK